MDRNDAVCANNHKRRLSLSARRAWIEIEDDGILSTGAPVALRKESVDRNFDSGTFVPAEKVALRKESVDRNPGFAKYAYGRIVALRKESVDRNGNSMTGCCP